MRPAEVVTVALAALAILAGLVIFVDGICVTATYLKYEEDFSPFRRFQNVPAGLGGSAGSLDMVFGALVILATWKSKRTSLITCVVLLVLLALTELVSGGTVAAVLWPMAYHKQSAPYFVPPLLQAHLKTTMKDAFRNAFAPANGTGSTPNPAFPTNANFDALQANFQCCGVEGPEDYPRLGRLIAKSCCVSLDRNGECPEDKAFQWGCSDVYYFYWRHLTLQFTAICIACSVFPMVAAISAVVMLHTK